MLTHFVNLEACRHIAPLSVVQTCSYVGVTVSTRTFRLERLKMSATVI